MLTIAAMVLFYMFVFATEFHFGAKPNTARTRPEKVKKVLFVIFRALSYLIIAAVLLVVTVWIEVSYL